MGETRGTERVARGRLRRWATGLQVSQMWQLALVGILGVTALFGGLDTVDTRISSAQVGDSFSDGQFTVTVDRASVLPAMEAGDRVILPPVPGRHYLGVVATVRNDGTVPGSMSDEISLEDLPGAEFQSARRFSDSERVGSIGPGLTENLVFIWTVPEEALHQGDSVTLRVYGKTFGELLTTYGKDWVPSNTDYTRVTVPVRVKT